MNLFSAIEPRPEYGPFQIGRDSVAEILSIVSDIAALPPIEHHRHLMNLVATYPPEAFADALMCLATGIEHLTAHQASATPMSGPPSP